jgi:hypothetical protein
LSNTREKVEFNGAVPQPLIDLKKTYDSARKGALYNTLTEFGIPLKLVRLIKMCTNETHKRIHTGKCLMHFLSTTV